MLEELLKAAPDAIPVMNSILEQIEEWKRLPKAKQESFRFKVTPAKAALVSKAYRDAIFAGENTQDKNSQELYRNLITDSTPMMQVFVTKGRCDYANRLVMSRFVIGKDIELPRYSEIITSRDSFMAEKYTPNCTMCEGYFGKKNIPHDTLMSTTQYVPQSTIALFDAADNIELRMLAMEGSLMHASAIQAVKPRHVRKIAEDREVLRMRYDQAISHQRETLANSTSRALFVSSRIKGHERLTEKVIRIVADHYRDGITDIAKMKAINDVYGIRVVTRNRADALETARMVQSIINYRYGAAAFAPTGEDAENNLSYVPEPIDLTNLEMSTPKILEMDKPGKHHSYRIWATIDLAGTGTPVLTALQFQGLDDFYTDQGDHQTYEEKQRAKLNSLNRIVPVDALRGALDKIFTYKKSA